jgi:hypothetical protein
VYGNRPTYFIVKRAGEEEDANESHYHTPLCNVSQHNENESFDYFSRHFVGDVVMYDYFIY